MVVVARLRAAPIVGWQAGCAVLLGMLIARLPWAGDPLDAVRYMIFAQPLTVVAIAAVLIVWAYWLAVWRRRHAFVRHDGRTLYRGGAASWPLIAIRDVTMVRGELGMTSLRLVVDDDSEVTRALVPLPLLDGSAEAVRGGVLFAAGGLRGVPVGVTVN